MPPPPPPSNDSTTAAAEPMDSTDQLHWPKGDFGPCTDVYFQAEGGGQKRTLQKQRVPGTKIMAALVEKRQQFTDTILRKKTKS